MQSSKRRELIFLLKFELLLDWQTIGMVCMPFDCAVRTPPQPADLQVVTLSSWH